MNELGLGTDDGITAVSEFTQATPEHASELLELMIELGMLPPRIDFMIGNMRASDNAWENEDE